MTRDIARVHCKSTQHKGNAATDSVIPHFKASRFLCFSKVLLLFSPSVFLSLSGFPSGADRGWRGETRRDLQHGQTWRQREAACGEQSGYENPETPQWRADHRGGGQSFHSHCSNSYEGRPLNRNQHPKQNRGRLHHNRGRYQLAPR